MSNEARTKQGDFQLEARAKQEDFQIEARVNLEKKLNEPRVNDGEKTIEQRVNSEELSNEQLAARIKAGVETADNMLKLWQQTQDFITLLAKKYSAYAEMEDLQQEGYLALYDAVDKYEPDKGVAFINYAAYWIRQYMRRYVDNTGNVVRLPVHIRGLVWKYKQFVREYRQYYGTKPEERTVCYYLGISPDKLKTIRESACMEHIRSLSEPVEGTDDLTLSDMAASGEDMEADIAKEFDIEQMRRELWEAVGQLEKVQQDVIRCRYQRNMTLKETGQTMGVGIERVRQVENRAMRMLRLPNRNKKFQGYYEEYISVASSRHIGMGEYSRTWTSEVERDVLHL